MSVQPLDNFLEHAAKVHNQVSTTREKKSPAREKESEKKSLCCVSKSEQVWIISISAMMIKIMMRPSLKNVLHLIHTGDVTSCAVKSTRWHEDTQRALRVIRSRRGKVTPCHVRSYCAFSIGNKKEEAAAVITARTLHQYHPRGCFPIVFFFFLDFPPLRPRLRCVSIVVTNKTQKITIWRFFLFTSY